MASKPLKEAHPGAALADWVLDAALTGAGPLSSADELAREYLIDQSFVANDQRADRLVLDEASRRFTTGLLSGYGSVLKSPGGAPRAVRAGWDIVTVAADDEPQHDMIEQMPPARVVELREPAIERLHHVAGHPRGTRDMLVPGHSVDELVAPTWCLAVGAAAIALFRRFTAGARTCSGVLKLSNWEAAG